MRRLLFIFLLFCVSSCVKNEILEADSFKLQKAELLGNTLYISGICMHSAYTISNVEVDYRIKSMPNVIIKIEPASHKNNGQSGSANFSVAIDENTSLISLGEKASPIWIRK